MWIGSYTGIKIIHDQKIAEALEYSCTFTAEQKTQKHSLLHIVGTLLARQSTSSIRKSEIAPSSDCEWQHI